MKKVITMLVLGVTILSTALLGGCGKSDPTISKEKTPYAIVKEKNADGQYVAESYLTEKHPEVIKIKETVEGYIKAYTTIDYKTTDGMGTYGYINNEMLKDFKEKNDAAETVKIYKDNALSSQFESIKIDTISLNKDLNKSEIRGTFRFKYLEASEGFMKNNNIKKDSIYERTFILQLEKQSDIWKVFFREVGDRKIVS